MTIAHAPMNLDQTIELGDLIFEYFRHHHQEGMSSTPFFQLFFDRNNLNMVDPPILEFCRETKDLYFSN